jgi:hypothetical protein
MLRPAPPRFGYFGNKYNQYGLLWLRVVVSFWMRFFIGPVVREIGRHASRLRTDKAQPAARTLLNIGCPAYSLKEGTPEGIFLKKQSGGFHETQSIGRFFS